MLRLYTEKTLANLLRFHIQIDYHSIVKRTSPDGSEYGIRTLGHECLTPGEMKYVCDSIRRDLDKIERDVKCFYDQMKNHLTENDEKSEG